MKKLVVLAGLVAAALLLGAVGTAVKSDQAQAKPTDILAIDPIICLMLTAADWDADSDGDTDIDEADAAFACDSGWVPGDGLSNPDNLADLADALGGAVDDPDTYAALAAYSAGQLNENIGKLAVLVFVSNDDALSLDADEGVWASSGASLAACPGDEDCNADGTAGDKVVVDYLLGDGVADLGEWEAVATQSGVDVFLDYTVVGDPDEITLTVVGGDTIQGDYPWAGGCPGLAADIGGFMDIIDEEPTVTGLLATVVDDDGTELAGIPISFVSDDTDVVEVALDPWVTIDTGEGIAAPNFACGGDIGTATVEATMWFGNEDAEVEITVIGPPDAMTLTASPAQITCDGTTSSTVTAALVDADGNPVVDGTEVYFNVLALGTVDPLEASTVDGEASTKVTPLSGATAGVTVLVDVPQVEAQGLEGNIRVDCAPAAPPAPPPAPPPVPPIVPPPTGDAGLLP